MPQFSTSQKASQNPRKCTSAKIRNRWSRRNHQFNPIKTNRCFTLDVNSMDMNKVNIIQTVPKTVCDCFVDTCTYCKFKALHPFPISSDWSSEDWHGKKAKVREQRLLIDLDFHKPDPRQMTDSEILNELLIQNLNMQENGKEEEKSPEIRDTQVLPPEVAAVTPMMEETKWENTTEEKDDKLLTDQEQNIQKDEEEYAIYIGGVSGVEESNTETDSDESPYFF